MGDWIVLYFSPVNEVSAKMFSIYQYDWPCLSHGLPLLKARSRKTGLQLSTIKVRVFADAGEPSKIWCCQPEYALHFFIVLTTAVVPPRGSDKTDKECGIPQASPEHE